MVSEVKIMKKILIISIFALTALGLLGTVLVGQSAGDKSQHKVNLPSTSQPLDLAQLKSTAEKITVKISSSDTLGSGTIISVQKPFYQVVTNAHVIRDDSNNLIITTSDNKQHRVHSIRTDKFKPYDLALLTFSAQKSVYPVAKSGESALIKANEPVVAAGFSANGGKPSERNFRFSWGKISFIASRPLEDGYSIGYTNLIEKGMSGGPVLNMAGDLIAINGIHADPLWGNSFNTKDLKILRPLTSDQVDQLSWAISIHIFLPKKLVL
jgi:S1-C subfamily serine protease